MGDHALLANHRQDSSSSNSVDIFNWLGRPAPLAATLGGHRTLFFTLATICLAYTAAFGVFFNLVLFFIDVLQAGNASAANNANYWLGTQFLCAIFGAFVAEATLGRLWTCASFLLAFALGMALMTVSVTNILSESIISSGSMAFFYFSLYLVALGAGAYQPALQSLGADQFDTEGDKSTFFTWYLVFDNVGLVLADTLVVYIVTSQGWVFGFWVCTAMAGATFLLFMCGLPFYRQYSRSGANPYRQALQVLIAATRKWKVKAPREGDLLFEIPDDENSASEMNGKLAHSQSWRFLDKAATVLESEELREKPRDPWKLCTVTQVEEVKQVLRLLPIWACNIFFYTVYGQGGTFFIEQGLVMNMRLGNFQLQAATMNIFNLAAVVFGPPIYDWCFVPILRRFTGFSRGLTPLQRMGGGYILSVASMAAAAILERTRLGLISNSVQISILWQIPQYVLLGAAQFLGAVGQLEFFYVEAPESLRSLGSSFYGTSIAAGNYLSSVLVVVVTGITSGRGSEGGWIPRDLNEGHLDYFFWLLAGLTFLNLLVFGWCSRSFVHATK